MAERLKGLLTRALRGNAEVRLHIDAPGTPADMAAAVASLGRDLAAGRDTLLVVCVGTDRSIGDALGPLVGSFLAEQERRPFRILGTLDEPVHASNLEDTLARIAGEYRHPLVVAVDACLGRSESVGSVTVARGPLRPGAGVNKSLPAVGEMHVTGVVNVGGFMEYFVLQNTRLNLVMRMARVIAQGMSDGLNSVAANLGVQAAR